MERQVFWLISFACIAHICNSHIVVLRTRCVSEHRRRSHRKRPMSDEKSSKSLQKLKIELFLNLTACNTTQTEQGGATDCSAASSKTTETMTNDSAAQHHLKISASRRYGPVNTFGLKANCTKSVSCSKCGLTYAKVSQTSGQPLKKL